MINNTGKGPKLLIPFVSIKCIWRVEVLRRIVVYHVWLQNLRLEVATTWLLNCYVRVIQLAKLFLQFSLFADWWLI